MRKHWKVATILVATCVALTIGGVAGFAAGGARSDDPLPALGNDHCAGAFDLGTSGYRAVGSTQVFTRDNDEPLYFGPDAYFKVNVPAGQQVIVDVQAAWRPSLAITDASPACNGQGDIDTPVREAPGGSTLSYVNSSASPVTATIRLAGNRREDFGRYYIEAAVALPAVQDEVGVAAETAAEHFLPRRDQWTFVEGTTRDGFVEFITMLSDSSQTITIEYMDERGPQPAQSCLLPARTRVTIRVNANPGPSPDGMCRDGFYGDGPGHDVAVRLTGTDEFRAERVVYHKPGVVDGSAASSASTGDHD